MKVAIVTGGGSGIGKAIAKKLYTDGFSVAFFGRRDAVLQDAVSAIDPGGGRSHAVPINIGERSAVERAFAAVIDR